MEGVLLLVKNLGYEAGTFLKQRGPMNHLCAPGRWRYSRPWCVCAHFVFSGCGHVFCSATHEAPGNYSCMPRQHVKVFCQHEESRLYPCFCFQEKMPRFQSVYQVYRLCSNWLSYITKTHELPYAITKKPHPIHFIVSSTL